ncbi:hypothetical protein E1A91_D11G015100v1 [Gossypium mustelinum]|uniref:Uncharacterized protein n=1 Tax=Gossypium mustelinum TaxID=34275 RepID=A0A5D2SMK0_GOSMU|nr:hypothetical protein E1A91_D11G015100v1 [Gossypium mustelinum]
MKLPASTIFLFFLVFSQKTNRKNPTTQKLKEEKKNEYKNLKKNQPKTRNIKQR